MPLGLGSWTQAWTGFRKDLDLAERGKPFEVTGSPCAVNLNTEPRT
jgi:hypothetical protein